MFGHQTLNRQCDFSRVESSVATYPCTPVFAKVGEDVIRINASEVVGFSPTGEASRDERNTNVIVCGARRMRSETLHKLVMAGMTPEWSRGGMRTRLPA